MAKGAAKVSPFAPARLPEMPPVPGVRLAAGEAGIRYQGRKDLMTAVLDAGSVVAGVLTRSKTCSAPVLWCREGLKHGKARALVVNSGNANAFTGRKGAEATRITAEAAANAVGCSPGEVYISSTGVIGEPLEATKFAHLLDGLTKSAKADAWHQAASAIMTTDTFPKLATRKVRLGSTDVVINGFAKGAGMIAPDLATMLVYIFTDAAVAQPALQSMLVAGADTTFNCITVDSDTSTSDTVLLFATGAAAARGARRRERSGRAAHRLRHRQLAAREDGDRRRRPKLGPHRHGGGQEWRGSRPRSSRHNLRRRAGRKGRRARGHLRREDHRQIHGRPRDQHRHRPGPRHG
jgi:glutamate N-acetyltransferase/amino-acid N-acetyltransferase